MRRRLLSILLLACLGAVGFAVAGCGGGGGVGIGGGTTTTPTTSGGGETTAGGITAAGCASLRKALDDLQNRPTGAFDYEADRNAMHGLATGVPSFLTSRVELLAGVWDRIANKAHEIGLASGDTPTEDQINQLGQTISPSQEERDAFDAVQAYVSSGCGSGGGTSTTASTEETVETATTTEPPPTTAPATTAPVTTSGGGTVTSDDCAGLRNFLNDAANNLGVHDYEHVRDFLRDFAMRAPSAIAEEIAAYRDYYVKYADAAHAAGVNPGETPTQAQLDQISSAVPITSELLRIEDGLRNWVAENCS